MNGFTRNGNMVLKLLSFLFIFHTSLFATSTSLDERAEVSSSQYEQVVTDQEHQEEVALDSFGNTGMMLMMLLTSLLGTFFVKDEFASSL